MHDVPAKNDDGSKRFSAPLINVLARSASSIDNAHAVSFFLINDEGTWLIKHARNQDALALLSKLPPRWEDWTEGDWLAAAASLKHRLYKERLDFPRHWPYYFIWNRQLSNRPGTTILLPIVDLTRQMINVIISLLSEEDGQRPLFVDDWQRFRPQDACSTGARGSPAWSASCRTSRIRSSAGPGGRGGTGSTPSIRRRSALPARCEPTTRRSSSCRT